MTAGADLARCYATEAIRVGPVPRPMLSERRLAQLMAARGSQRAVLLARAMHALARSMPHGSRVNLVDVAYALLAPDNGRLLAETVFPSAR